MKHNNSRNQIAIKVDNAVLREWILDEDLSDLLQRAKYVKARRDRFPIFDVTPITDVKEGLKKGAYTEQAHVDSKRFISTSLILPPKKIILASFRENEYCTTMPKAFQRKDYSLLFKEYKLKLVEHSLHYFLGLMAIDAKDWSVTRACYNFMEVNDLNVPKEQIDKLFANVMFMATSNMKENYFAGVQSCVNSEEKHHSRHFGFWENLWFCDKEKFHMFEALD